MQSWQGKKTLPSGPLGARTRYALPSSKEAEESREMAGLFVMRKNVAITHIMTEDPVTTHEGESISQIRKIFQENDIHHLPVVRGKELVGIISWTDLMRVSFGDAFGQSEESVDMTLDYTITIEELMQKNPRTLTKDHSVRDAAVALSGADFHALPVVSGNELVGIVTTKDLIRFLVSLY
jgi:CBS domain-containing protein